MLDMRTDIDRRLVCIILVPFCVLALVVAIVSYGVATLEYGYAAWTKTVEYPPALTTIYERLYFCVWPLSLGIIGCSLALLRRATCRVWVLALLLSLGTLGLAVSMIITALAVYLVNQSFIMR
jgi:hypothetical protein